MIDLDYPPFVVDRVEDAVPPGPQAPQIRRPVRERLRRLRLIGGLADGSQSAATPTGIVAEEAPNWAILVLTSVVVRRSWSTYATDTAPLARPATAPLSHEQGIQAQPNSPVTAPPVTGHFLPFLRLATFCR